MDNNGYRYIIAVKDEYYGERSVCEVPCFTTLSVGESVLVGSKEERYMCVSEPCLVDEKTYNMICDVTNDGDALEVVVGREITTVERFAGLETEQKEADL